MGASILPKQARPNLSPALIGATGTTIYAGYIREEYLNELVGLQAYDTLDEMRRGDGQIQMVLRAIKNPIRSATFKHEAVDESDKAQKVADFLDWHWFKNPYWKWKQFLTESLTHLEFGFSVHEWGATAYQHREFGLVHVLGALSFRKQKTIQRWIITPEDGLTGVYQIAFGDTVKTGATTIFIPVDNLCIFTNDQEGDNYEGMSILRGAYGPWFRKKYLLRMNMIGTEKGSMGIPVGKYPQGADDDQRKNFETVMANFTAHENAYIVVPVGYEIDVKTIKYNAEQMLASVFYEDGQIAKSVLLNFLELGQNGNGGSYNLGADLSNMTMQSLQYIADQICEKMDAINEKLVEWNFGDIDLTPTCRCSGINSKAGKELAETVKIFCDAKIIRPDDRLEAQLRETYNLPRAETTREEDAENAPPPPTPGAPPDPNADPNAPPVDDEEGPPSGPRDPKDPAGAPAVKSFSEQPAWSPFRPLTKYEEGLNFSEMAGDLGRFKDGLARTMRSDLQRTVKSIMGDVQRRLGSKPKSRMASFRKMQIDTSRYQKVLFKEMARVVGAGTKQARKDLAVKLGTAKLAEDSTKSNLEFLPEHVKGVLKEQAKRQAENQANELKKILDYEGIDADASGLPDKEVVSDLEDALNKYVDGGQIENAAGTIASQAYNQGRDGFFFEPDNISQIQAFQYSAIIDGKTTDICLSLDGKIFKPNDPDIDRFRPPNHYNCRSILIPITINEDPPELTGLSPDPSNPTLLDEYKNRGKAPPDLGTVLKSRNL